MECCLRRNSKPPNTNWKHTEKMLTCLSKNPSYKKFGHTSVQSALKAKILKGNSFVHKHTQQKNKQKQTKPLNQTNKPLQNDGFSKLQLSLKRTTELIKEVQKQPFKKKKPNNYDCRTEPSFSFHPRLWLPYLKLWEQFNSEIVECSPIVSYNNSPFGKLSTMLTDSLLIGWHLCIPWQKWQLNSFRLSLLISLSLCK